MLYTLLYTLFEIGTRFGPGGHLQGLHSKSTQSDHFNHESIHESLMDITIQDDRSSLLTKFENHSEPTQGDHVNHESTHKSLVDIEIQDDCLYCFLYLSTSQNKIKVIMSMMSQHMNL